MSDRPHVYVSHRTPTTDEEAGQSPNQYVPEVMVEVRIYAPSRYPREQLRWRLADAFAEAYAKVERQGDDEGIWPIVAATDEEK